MNPTRSTLLMRVRDPADAEAWGEFVALYEPLLRAYVRGRGAPSGRRPRRRSGCLRATGEGPAGIRVEPTKGPVSLVAVASLPVRPGRLGRRRRNQARAEDAWLNRLSEMRPSAESDSDLEWKVHAPPSGPVLRPGEGPGPVSTDELGLLRASPAPAAAECRGRRGAGPDRQCGRHQLLRACWRESEGSAESTWKELADGLTSCPGDNELLSVVTGDGVPDAVRRHVGDCGACRNAGRPPPGGALRDPPHRRRGAGRRGTRAAAATFGVETTAFSAATECSDVDVELAVPTEQALISRPSADTGSSASWIPADRRRSIARSTPRCPATWRSRSPMSRARSTGAS